MKRCPKCYEAYQNTAMFCEADGQRLLNVSGVVVDHEDLVPDMASPRSTSFTTGLIGVLVGVLLCGGGFVAYTFLKSEPESNQQTRSPFAAQMNESSQPRPAPARVVEAAPAPSESPSPETEPTASPEAPAPQPPADAVPARLERGPVSTGEPQTASANSAKTKTIIEMQDGSIVEVDAAWKDGQGVWYRRGGLVSFVESPRVKAITARAEPKTTPASDK